MCVAPDPLQGGAAAGQAVDERQRGHPIADVGRLLVQLQELIAGDDLDLTRATLPARLHVAAWKR